uniref:RNA-editing substrate-binding complex 6 protein domain-containing protein n=1 Tax=Alexandrium monilatum TaxID=311494 RepID=A0A7S4QFG5_9DINO
MSEFNAQNLANTAWACSTLAMPDEPLLAAIASAAMAKINHFIPLELANLAWSFATLGVGNTPFLEAIASAASASLPQFRPCSLAILAWSFARLSWLPGPLMNSISAASRRNITAYGPQELANTAWSYATLSVDDRPLFAAIASASRRSLLQFTPQHLTNTAWSFAELSVWDCPLMTAISSAASRRISALRFGDAHTLLWSLERSEPFARLWLTFEAWIECGIATDVLDLGVLLPGSEALRDPLREHRAWHVIGALAPLRRDVQEIVAGATRNRVNPAAYVDKAVMGGALAGTQVARHGGHAQHKLAMLVQHVEALARRGPGAAEAVLGAVVGFSLKRFNHWLKVAAGLKGALIDCVLGHAGEPGHRLRLELGAFVGYSGIRLSGVAARARPWARPSRAWRVTSLEVEPLHVCVARHMLNLAERSGLAEVCTGQARDLIPRLADEAGGLGLGLVFMDHRGTRFHEERRLLEGRLAPCPGAGSLCDNVLHPGAPVLLWEEARPGAPRAATVWSLPEFGGEGCIEDWMAFARWEQP